MSEPAAEFPLRATERAIGRIKQLIAKDGREGVLLRIGLKGGGCSGLEYVMRLEEQARDNDLRADWDGVAVVCDPKSARFLQGTRLDFSGNLIGGGFTYDNPNAERKCGCGTSFTPKKSG